MYLCTKDTWGGCMYHKHVSVDSVVLNYLIFTIFTCGTQRMYSKLIFLI